MKKLKAGFIGFLPFGGSPEDMWKTLESYAKIGYKGIELGDMFLRGGDPEESLKRVKDLGMEVLCTNIPMAANLSIDCVPTVIENAHKLGVHRAACMVSAMKFHSQGMFMLEHFPTYDEAMRELETLEAIAKELAKEDIVLSFHNHETEFITFYKGESWFDQMVKNTEYLQFELDCGWAMYGHRDPLKVMDLLGGRLAAIHIKDYMEGSVSQHNMSKFEDNDPMYQFHVPVDMPNLCAPGAGLLPTYDILEKALKMGLDYAIIEQDFQKILTQEESVLLAYLLMKETGFVE